MLCPRVAAKTGLLFFSTSKDSDPVKGYRYDTIPYDTNLPGFVPSKRGMSDSDIV